LPTPGKPHPWPLEPIGPIGTSSIDNTQQTDYSLCGKYFSSFIKPIEQHDHQRRPELNKLQEYRATLSIKFTNSRCRFVTLDF